MISKTTYGKRIGYLDHGSDFDGSLDISEKALDYLGLVGMVPMLDPFLDKNRLYRSKSLWTAFHTTSSFCIPFLS